MRSCGELDIVLVTIFTIQTWREKGTKEGERSKYFPLKGREVLAGFVYVVSLEDKEHIHGEGLSEKLNIYRDQTNLIL